MLQDVLAGRITEIEWMNGALLKSARMQSIPMPTHETVYRLVKALEKR
jgi:2-dehydropantoate 2-reductase